MELNAIIQKNFAAIVVVFLPTMHKPVFISLFVSAIIWGIFYFFTIFLALRGYMDLLFPRYMIFNTIVIFMACLKKYEIKNFVILNYKLIKDKITKSH